jgi:tetratricopeptide (TPR) repeat protein
VSVVFEIEIHLTRHATKRPFASIEDLSQFPEEEEVLFWVGSTFRIVNVHDRRSTDGYYLVKMIKAEDEDDDGLNELRRELDKQYSRYENLCDLGFALIGMADYDRAERYFQMLLEYTPKFSPSIGLILNGLGISFANRGDYLKALEFQEEALKFWTKGHPAEYHDHHIANTHVHIGGAYRHLGQDELALKFLLKAADMQSRTESSAFIYNEIAITYRDKGNNRLALEYFLKALNIDENVLKLSQYHPKLATAYNNIGEIYVNLGHYDHAARYLEHALEIRLKGTVTTHNDLATIYHNLGAVYTDRKEFQKALDMQQKALEIDARTLNADHESLAPCRKCLENSVTFTG